MSTTKAELERAARELSARSATDNDALTELCEVYWRLGEQDSAVQIFAELLRRTRQPEEGEFDEIYFAALRATRTCPTPVRRRARFMQLVALLESTTDIDGLVAECGCYRGLSSYVLCRYLKRANPLFDGSGYHIVDSFQGLSEPTADDEIPDHWSNAEGLRQMTKRGFFAAPLAAVKIGLAAFPQITYHPGWIPLSFNTLPESNYRFVHVDVDLYDPTLDAFDYFYPRLLPGGLIVSDDYSWPGARTAIEEFCTANKVPFEINAVEQAIVRKKLG